MAKSRSKSTSKNHREERETGNYPYYRSTLDNMFGHFKLDVADEIRQLGCRDVLDLGCGKAVALKELEETLPDSVNLHGLNFRHEPEFDQLQRAKVKVGNWKALIQHFEEGSMDFVIWHQGYEYVTAQELNTLFFQISKVLRPGGRLLFNLSSPHMRDPRNAQLVEKLLRKHKFDIGRPRDIKTRGRSETRRAYYVKKAA